MEWGPHEGTLRARFEAGKKTPALENKPEIDLGLDAYWEAFCRLSEQRQLAPHIVQPIAVSEMLMYADLIGVDEPEDFVDLMVEMDRAFIKHHLSKSKAGT